MKGSKGHQKSRKQRKQTGFKELAHICVLCSAIASPSLLSSSPIRVNPIVKPRALQQVEQFIQCAQAWCLTKGQCTAKHLQHIPRQVGLKVSGSKPELVEHCYNNLVSLHRCFGVPDQLDSDAHVEPKMPNDILGEGNDELRCAVCDSDEVQEGNAMLLCDGDPEQEVGYHQQCLPPPLLRYYRGIGFAPIGPKNKKNHPDATRK